VPKNAADTGGLEFARYAGQVAQAMQAQGYAQAPSLEAATMVVRVDYGVDEGQQRVERDPFARGYGYDPFWSGYGPYAGLGPYGGVGPYGGLGPYAGFYGRPYYSRFGYWGARSPFYYGWGDPYVYGFDGPYQESRVYTVFESFLDLDIRRKADNAALFEGHAQARSANDHMGVLVPNLIEAMFTGFPGHSGETIKITVPAAKKS